MAEEGNSPREAREGRKEVDTRVLRCKFLFTSCVAWYVERK